METNWKIRWNNNRSRKWMYEIQLQFEQTDTNQIHVQVIDMDQSTNDNLAMVAEMTADLN